MSHLADKLATAPITEAEKPQHGPKPSCDIYGPGDLDDWQMVEDLRKAKSWATAQATVDGQLGISERIPTNFFVYHWKRKCRHWPRDIRR